MPDFDILTSSGIIGFYQSCEVTQIFLHNRFTAAPTNVFILACFEEKPHNGANFKFLGSRYALDSNTSLCMQRYSLSLTETQATYQQLLTSKVWNYNGNTALLLGKLKKLSKQFIPSSDDHRINHILKNNFHSGSYLIEFFDESKSHVSHLLTLDEKKLDAISAHIQTEVPIDLSVVRDRIGNIIFQFPITIAALDSKALKTGDGIQLNFSWHSQLSAIPDCEIQIESSLDNNLMSAILETYNKTENQKVITGNSDAVNNIRLWRKTPALLLSSFSGAYIKEINFTMNVQSPEPRIVEIDKKRIEINVASNESTSKKPFASYTAFISAQVNNSEKKALAKSLSFKQYNNYGHENALQDLRTLLQQRGDNGIYLWDPFLSADDILRTLYYSNTIGVELRAIGSIDKTVKTVYKTRSKSARQIIAAYNKQLNNPNNNNYGLNLEFRIQYENHGWAFHDRFLLFPGNTTEPARAYSLGTSINSFGNRHHILQEVSYAQPVIDAFNDLWQQLDKPECIVWKYPKV